MSSQKDTLRYQARYRRSLPHIQPPHAVFFVTYRLADSLPIPLLREMRLRAREERLQIAETEDDALKQMRLDELHRREFGRWDRSLDRLLCGPKWLSQPAVAQIVVENLHHFDGQRYDLDAYCIMPNHVHLLMQPRPKDDGEFYSLAKIMHSMKSFTAHAANRILGRQGRFWQPEFYDRVVRSDAEWERIVRYILNNPVKAGLVGEQDDWRWSYYSGRR